MFVRVECMLFFVLSRAGTVAAAAAGTAATGQEWLCCLNERTKLKVEQRRHRQAQQAASIARAEHHAQKKT